MEIISHEQMQHEIDKIADKISSIGGLTYGIPFSAAEALCNAQLLKDQEHEAKAVSDAVNKVIEAYDEYIKLLSDELEDTVEIASIVHGWKSHRYEEGVKCRAKIQQLKQQYGGK